MERTVLFLFLLCFYVCAAEGQKNITAESGQNVNLTCRAPSSQKTTVVEWSRADLGQKSVLMYRDGHPETDMQVKNRVDLQDRQMKEGDVSLILKNVTAADNGTYECRVIQRRTNRWKRAHLKTAPICIIYLRVLVPPGPGGTTEDGGKEDARKEDSGKDISVGLKVGVSAAVVFVVAVVVVVVFFVIYIQRHQNQVSYQPPVELQPV